MKYAIVTFGCRVNQADSFHIEEQLLAAGGCSTATQDADLVVVNSCSVTAAADQGARQVVRQIARANPSAKIVVTGCYATRQAEEVAGLPGVVQVVPNARKAWLAMDLGLTTAERFGEGDGGCGAEIAPGLAGRTAYTLRVQTGCDQACAYCIIPTTRGQGCSKPVRDVLAEIARVQAAGYREIALTGVHLGSYGRDLPETTSLLRLLELIGQRASGTMFRISSLEPMDCSAEIVDLVAGSPIFAPHFHLPLQHASDRMLVAMRRPYTLAYYRRLVDRVRERIPHASIGSDLIVGFPGETPEDFERLAMYLEGSPLTHMHVFPYSDRPGTAAAGRAQKVHGAIIRERAGVLRAIGKTLNRAFHRTQLGAIRPGLTTDDGTVVVTDNYLKVSIPPGLQRNQRVHVRVQVAHDQLVGEVVSAS